MGNTYVGPNDQDVVDELASKALELQIRQAVDLLIERQSGRYAQVVSILRDMIGEDEE